MKANYEDDGINKFHTDSKPKRGENEPYTYVYVLAHSHKCLM